MTAGAVSTDEKTIAAQLARLGTAMAPSATWAANKGFIGDGAVVSYLHNEGDNHHETYGNGTSLCVRALQHLRICPHRSSQVERQDPSHV
jgi:hypothetical protein